MAGAGAVHVSIRTDDTFEWWRPPLQALASAPHLVMTAALTTASVAVAVLIAIVVLVTGRVPAPLARFQAMTLRHRVRAYSYFFVLRTGWPPFLADDPKAHVEITPVERMARRDVVRRAVLLPHVLALVPIAVVMDVCYPVWIALCSIRGGWPPAFRSLLLAVER